ncbi:hypothetical protein Q0590_26515 [Rhodocytophaga aerolata]|uniref:DUF2975 domain-containing protein n=2 Tax=Rhodocytophaga aerolata TaxID=455078 RepID=A0ABT8RDU3_9BACT|nr:hypothetical protein [Rhodocytophaga aerolata]
MSELKRTITDQRINPDKLYLLVNKLFKLFLALAVLIIFLYCFAPQYYMLLMPIESLNDPLINHTGIFLLFISLVWLLFAQIRIQIFFRSISQSDKVSATDYQYKWLYIHSKLMLSAGIALMLIGLFVTISNLFAIYLLLMALVAYFIQVKLADDPANRL